jgi:hypothetical protein
VWFDFLSSYASFIFFLIFRYPSFPYYKDKNNHPMFGKTHTKEALALISKPGELNPMFGRNHSEATKAAMSEKKNKYLLGVGLYFHPLT